MLSDCRPLHCWRHRRSSAASLLVLAVIATVAVARCCLPAPRRLLALSTEMTLVLACSGGVARTAEKTEIGRRLCQQSRQQCCYFPGRLRAGLEHLGLIFNIQSPDW